MLIPDSLLILYHISNRNQWFSVAWIFMISIRDTDFELVTGINRNFQSIFEYICMIYGAGIFLVLFTHSNRYRNLPIQKADTEIRCYYTYEPLRADIITASPISAAHAAVRSISL